MPALPVPGALLDHEISDEGGPAVVQLHGLTSSRARDRLLGLDLGSGLSGTRLLRFDARGHGRSSGRPVPTDYAWERLAHDLLALLDHTFPGEQVHGVGQSMGAGTLLHALALDPGRFSALTVMVPPTAWETRAPRTADYRAVAELVEREGLDGFLATDALHHPPPARLGVAASLPDCDVALLPSVFRGAALSDLPVPEALAGTSVPALVLAWTGDPAHPVSTAERLHTLLTSSRLEVARTPEEVAAWPALLMAHVSAAAAQA